MSGRLLHESARFFSGWNEAFVFFDSNQISVYLVEHTQSCISLPVLDDFASSTSGSFQFSGPRKYSFAHVY